MRVVQRVDKHLRRHGLFHSADQDAEQPDQLPKTVFVSLTPLIDVALVLLMIALVLRSFGLELGALFSVYFFTSILSGQEFRSDSLLRYDWLLYIVVAVCLLDKGRHARAAFFLTLSAMLRLFPAVLFYAIAVTMFQKLTATRALDKQSIRFTVTAGATALLLFAASVVVGRCHPALAGLLREDQPS